MQISVIVPFEKQGVIFCDKPNVIFYTYNFSL